jgi:uncharacterized RDD family membrane protein YckC
VGPAGLVYGDVPNRVIAIIIDGIILFVIEFIIQVILIGILGANAVGALLSGVISFAISIAYFTYLWSSSRATIGMRALGLQIGDAGDGHTIPMNQALRRAAAMWGPIVIGQILAISGGYLLSGLGGLLSLVSLILVFGWPIYLLYTTAQSPTKQGFHDVFAHTIVAKAARTVA